MMEAWSPPDPGFNRSEYSESELEDDIANLDESFEEQSPPRNPFIDDEERQQMKNPHTRMTKSPIPVIAWWWRNSRKMMRTP